MVVVPKDQYMVVLSTQHPNRELKSLNTLVQSSFAHLLTSVQLLLEHHHPQQLNPTFEVRRN